MRKSEIIKIIDDGNELTFRVTQMPATKAERWANRAGFLLIQAGKNSDVKKLNAKKSTKKDSGDEAFSEVMKAIASLDYEKVEPLYNELIECCEYIPNGNGAGIVCSQATIDAQITDPMNLYKLRLAAAKLNFAFFTNVLQFRAPAKNIITFSKNTQK